jgi:GNAT superfamily N-acetyltransferase
MLETGTAENWMSKRTAFCIDLCAHNAIEDGKSWIYQKMYEQLSRVWVSNRYHTHEISFFAKDTILSFTLFRLGFGMTHFELLRGLNPVEGLIADVPVKKITNEEPLKELSREHHFFYPTPPLFWWQPNHGNNVKRDDRILSGYMAVFAAFSVNKPVAYLSVKIEGTAETWLLADARNVQMQGAFAKEEYRHKGIGKALLQEAVNWAHQNCRTRLYVEGESANIYGGNFWLRHFTPVVYSVRRCIDERIVASA